MPWLRSIPRCAQGLCLLALAAWPAIAATSPAPTATVSCLTSQAVLGTCAVPAADLAAGRKRFDEGVRLEKQGNTAEALERMKAAADAVPESIEFSTARELLRQRLVFKHVQKGAELSDQKKSVEAQAEFQAALALDPENIFAKERLSESLGQPEVPRREKPQVVEDQGLIELFPDGEKHEFHLKGDSNDLLTRVAATYGVTVVFDESVHGRPTRFDLDASDFFTAMSALGQVTKTFWTPLDRKQIFIAQDTDQNHKTFDRFVYRTFYLPGLPAQEMNDIISILKTILEVKFVNAEPQNQTLSVRAPQRMMDAISQVIEAASAGRPQMVLDVQVIEVTGNFTRNLGINTSPQFTLYNIPAGALAGLLGAGSQDLLNQILSSGINSQAGLSALQALLGQAASQSNNIFSQPLATFGGGISLFGVSIPPVSAQLSVSKSDVRSLTRSTLRVAQGDTAMLHVGTRYPIVTSSFSASFSNSPVAGLFQNGSISTPPPSFNFEDLGLAVKVKPFLHAGGDVTMEMELELKSLGAQSFNGVPVISNRQYKGTIRLASGEPAVMTGIVTTSEQRGYNGVPFAGQLPLLKELTSASTKESAEDELLVIVTPHQISEGHNTTGTEIYLSPAR